MKLTFDEQPIQPVDFPTICVMRDGLDGTPGYEMPAVRVLTSSGIALARPYFSNMEAADRWRDATAELYWPHVASLEFFMLDVLDRKDGPVQHTVIDPPDDRPGREVQIIKLDSALVLFRIVLNSELLKFYEQHPGTVRCPAEPAILLGDHPGPLLIGKKFEDFV
jgi:hypothetical protein